MKLIACFLLSLAVPMFSAQDTSPVQISETKGNGEITVYATNTDTNLTRWIQVQVENSENLEADRNLPARAVLAPGSSRVLVILRKIDPRLGLSYRLISNQDFGNPDVIPSATTDYLLPYAHGTKHQITQGYLGKVTHQGIYALDFDMPQGTEICAARGGVVATVKQDSDTGGVGEQFAQMGNYIEILHNDGTWATYAHIEFHGALVREGARVHAGDPIALSGATGEASGPHLHFSVQKPTWGGMPQTYATPFLLGPDQPAFLKEGQFYYSWHPGGKSFKRIYASSIDQDALENKVTPLQGGSVRLREDKIDNTIFIYADNPLAHPIQATLNFGWSQNAQPSKALPLTRKVPAQSEVFLMSVLLTGGGSYESRLSYLVVP